MPGKFTAATVFTIPLHGRLTLRVEKAGDATAQVHVCKNATPTINHGAYVLYDGEAVDIFGYGEVKVLTVGGTPTIFWGA